MIRKIPSGVKTIAVKDYFKIRKDYSNNLRLRLRENGYWQAEYLPEIEEDIRPNKGKSKNGKRLTIRKSMETKDPDIAARRAVEWNIEKRRTDTQLRYQIGGSGKTLETYWEDYLQKEVGRARGMPDHHPNHRSYRLLPSKRYCTPRHQAGEYTT